MQDKLKRGLHSFITILKKPEMGVLPGHLAFSLMLSLVPTLTLITYVASVFHFSMDFIGDFITKAFSQDFANLLLGTNLAVSADWKFVVTLIVGYVIASNGAAALILSSNTIYGIQNDTFVKRRIKAFLMILIIILLFIFLLIFNVFGNNIIEMLDLMDLNKDIVTNVTLVISVLKGPISWFIVFIFIKILFTMAPDKGIRSHEVNKGAIFTTVGFIVVTYIYSLYATHFARYDVFYGNLASIVVLMIWLYLLSYIITIGLAFNYREEINTLEKTSKLEVVEEEKKHKH